MPARDRDLDFIVIGVQKGGTTSLWQYLRHHPQIAMPDSKEAPIFCFGEERIPEALSTLMRSSFGDAPPEAKTGKVAAHYMVGVKTVDVESIAERIAHRFPSVRLIALLRDPIERAMSHYRMSARRGFEQRSFDHVVDQLLEPEQLEIARAQPTETNSYLVQGEYTRILQIYRERFPAEQIHVDTTAQLSREPGPAIDRVLAFLDLPAGYRPDDLDLRHHIGGTEARLDPDAEAQLNAFMREHVWPELGSEAARVKNAFGFFMETWNVAPDDSRPVLSESSRRRLEAHYRADNARLAELGASAPWLDAWES